MGASEKPAGLCLALCSASRIASVALLEGDRLLLERSAETDRHQAESLLPLVDEVLSATSTRLGDLAGIGLSIGPGSFTSLRICVATVKGLVFGTSLPVVPVSTLQALAFAGGQGESDAQAIVATFNAQRDEVYAAGFAGAGGGFAARPDVLGELVYSADELAELLPAGCRLVGDGVAVVAERLAELRGEEITCDLKAPREAMAASIGQLAAAALTRGEGRGASDLAPNYVRRAEAEVTRTSERFEPPAGAGG
ncbi:MAG: tRNA threonylcarbamoyladenosine biosynthesis protein TsaB [Myxococcota bacterium]|jgi:tRNA threonylcarbamoyladenosine biosynthesis protein TsaB